MDSLIDSHSGPTFLITLYPALSDFVIPEFCIQKNHQRDKMMSGTHPVEICKNQFSDQNIIWKNIQFTFSDSLKSHTLFIITSYCQPNLEEFAILNCWRQLCSKIGSYWTVNWEDLGTSLICFGSECKMAEHFTRFTANYCLKTRTARRQLDRHLLNVFGVLVWRPEQPFIS